MNLYVIKDRVSGVQSPIFQARDHDAAKREMRQVCDDKNPVAHDLDLYHIGTYNIDKMVPTALSCMCIYNGSDALYDSATLNSIRRVPPEATSGEHSGDQQASY